MSRKWERMVEKNQRNVNKHREKHGKPRLSNIQKFKGRSIMLPIFCTAVVIMFVMFFGQMQEKDFIYWLTIISYSFLAIYFFFLKRPYLKVGKDTVATRKLGKERVVDAQDLEYITIQPGYVIIKVKDKRSHWMFGRMFNLFDTKEMAIRLQEFAKQNDVTINLETK